MVLSWPSYPFTSTLGVAPSFLCSQGALIKRILLVTFFAALLLPLALRADTIFNAKLTGAQASTNSLAGGSGTVILNTAQTSITVDENWFGLVSPAEATHIHCCVPAGVNAPVLFPLTIFLNATTGLTIEQTFAITPTQVTELEAGLMYFNVNDALFPGGEIRGQILAAPTATTPEPATFALLALGLFCAAGLRRKLSA
jgi:hypothetical protein